MVMPMQRKGEKWSYVLASESGLCDTVANYNNDLMSIGLLSRNKDIMEVYGHSRYASSTLEFNTDDRELLWKREEDKKEMTLAEIENELGYSIKIIKESEEN